ncbi:NAD-dependent epimerase/dehydratase family protein [Sphingomonas soli]|uniref:NAD-dependent epimerase/dehydratase family protein n=1 Tax=Sphingomonas soli TaxID=266127 RepID=UPI00082999E1|nr:NAD(P)-dependent oxidoreductase [Sphingomonas soli]
MILAITGATGFVGKRTLDLALAAGHQVRALTRRAQPPREGVVWVDGSLESVDSLARLASGADAVLHIAGVVNAPNHIGFIRGNVEGTQRMLDAAESMGVRRFVMVSSLSAREPQLSNYGRSKERAEALVRASALDWTIVRPPAVYGPGDMEMLDLFRLAKRGLALLPPGGQMSAIHADDLARLLIALAQTDPGRLILEPDDGVEGGWSHEAFSRAVGDAVGKRIRAFALPRTLLNLGAMLDGLFRRSGAKLTRDRVAYFCHPDWVVDPSKRPAPDLWTPQIETRTGLAATAEWYRAQGLL